MNFVSISIFSLISTMYYFCPKEIYCMYFSKKNNSHFILRFEVQFHGHPPHCDQGFLEPVSCLAGVGSHLYPAISICSSQLCPLFRVLLFGSQRIPPGPFQEYSQSHWNLPSCRKWTGRYPLSAQNGDPARQRWKQDLPPGGAPVPRNGEPASWHVPQQ